MNVKILDIFAFPWQPWIFFRRQYFSCHPWPKTYSLAKTPSESDQNWRKIKDSDIPVLYKRWTLHYDIFSIYSEIRYDNKVFLYLCTWTLYSIVLNVIELNFKFKIYSRYTGEYLLIFYLAVDMKDGKSEVYRGRPKLGYPSETVSTTAKTLIKMAGGELTISTVRYTHTVLKIPIIISYPYLPKMTFLPQSGLVSFGQGDLLF